MVASLGIFDDITVIRWDFYVHFTNISNFLCIGVMIASLIQTAKRKKDGYVTVAPILKFIGVLGILLTFLVFNIMLAGAEGREPQANWRIVSILFHVILPLCILPIGSSSASEESADGITPSFPSASLSATPSSFLFRRSFLSSIHPYLSPPPLLPLSTPISS